MTLSRYYATGTNGDAATTANTGGDQYLQTGGAGTISNTAPLIGSHLAVAEVGSSTSGLLETAKNISSTALAFDYYFRLEAGPSSEVTQIYVNSSGSRCLAVNLSSARKLIVRDASNALIFTGTAVLSVSASTIVRIAGYVTQSPTAGTVLVSMFTGTAADSLTQVDTTGTLTSINTGAATYDNVRFGAKAATSTATITTTRLGFGIDPAASGLPTAWTPAADNIAPTLTLTATKTVLFPGETSTLTASATDSDGTIASHTVTSSIAGVLSGTWPTYTVTAPASLTDQTATVTASATDNLGATSTATQTLTLKASAWRLCGSPGTPLIERLIT